MKFKLFLINFVIIQLGNRINCLKCYECKAKTPNNTCFDPLYEPPPYRECDEENNRRFAKLFATRFHANDKILYDIQNSADYECGVFEISYGVNNTREINRDCFPKLTSIGFCDYMSIKAGLENFNLTRCEVCTEDKCNAKIVEENSADNINGKIYVFVLALICYFYYDISA
ncbi:hypothetical protein ILUMI_00602 [Ignelater luminosus]|uniref:Protein sleepless n=1 Tax=Ignelater luminosus TaxID=2038154 RepID=A0A8K0DGX4_IGNLU|nr:hypothetical protein ILUMI_00602 [Ignelater luminosus]